MDYENVKESDFLDVEGLKKEFKKYAKDVLGYNDFEAELAATDLDNPYDAEFIRQEFDGDVTIDGVEYEVRECKTDFCLCGLFEFANKPPFVFYMFFKAEDVADNLVGSYRKAKKKYICSPCE